MTFQLSKYKRFFVVKPTGEYLQTESRTIGYQTIKPKWKEEELLVCYNAETGMYEVITEEEVKEYLKAKQEE